MIIVKIIKWFVHKGHPIKLLQEYMAWEDEFEGMEEEIFKALAFPSHSSIYFCNEVAWIIHEFRLPQMQGAGCEAVVLSTAFMNSPG